MSLTTFNNYTQSQNYAQYMKAIGWEIIRLNNDYFAYSKKIKFLSRSIIKIPRVPMKLNYVEIEKLAKKHQAILIKIEPDEKNPELFSKYKHELIKHDFYRDNFPILQTKTIIVDLSLSEDKFLKSLRSETRHHLRKSWGQNFRTEIVNNTQVSRYQTQCHSGLDPESREILNLVQDDKKISNNNSLNSQKAFEDFYALFEKCARERKFYSPFNTQMKTLWNSFEKKAVIILTYEKDNPEPLSGTLILTHENTAYYKYGASIPYGRNKYSSYFLFWEMFKWAREKGFKNFDLEGIYDERYHRTQKYVGFTQFKKGWSKNEVTYLGSFTKYYSLPLKLLAKIGILI